MKSVCVPAFLGLGINLTLGPRPRILTKRWWLTILDSQLVFPRCQAHPQSGCGRELAPDRSSICTRTVHTSESTSASAFDSRSRFAISTLFLKFPAIYQSLFDPTLAFPAARSTTGPPRLMHFYYSSSWLPVPPEIGLLPRTALIRGNIRGSPTQTKYVGKSLAPRINLLLTFQPYCFR